MTATPTWAEFVPTLHPDNRYEVEERAAIREYVANMPREKAELLTMQIDIFLEQFREKIPKPNWKTNAADCERQFYINRSTGRWFIMVPIEEEEATNDEDKFDGQFW